MYVGELRTEKKKVGRWLPASEMLIVSVCFSWSRKWIGEDAEKEEGKPYRSSAIHYTIDMIFEEMPKLWLIKWYYQKYRL